MRPDFGRTDVHTSVFFLGANIYRWFFADNVAIGLIVLGAIGCRAMGFTLVF